MIVIKLAHGITNNGMLYLYHLIDGDRAHDYAMETINIKRRDTSHNVTYTYWYLQKTLIACKYVTFNIKK